MFTVVKKLEISASHQLKLTYKSKCQNLHGHNWIVHIYARSAVLLKPAVCGLTATIVFQQALHLVAINSLVLAVKLTKLS